MSAAVHDFYCKGQCQLASVGTCISLVCLGLLTSMRGGYETVLQNIGDDGLLTVIL